MWAKGTACIAALAALHGAAGAQSPVADDGIVKLDISGSVRIRQEAISGQLRSGFNADDTLTSLRTRLYARYGSETLYAEGELYDSRVYGDNPGTPVTTGEVNAAELVQASLTYKANLSEGVPLRLQAGRFTLNLGSRRLVAADDYRNTTNGYTGLRADIGDPRRANLTAIYVLPQRRLPDDRASIDRGEVVWDREGAEARLWGAVGSLPLGVDRARLEATAIAFDERDTSDAATRDRSLSTLGLRYFREAEPEAFDFDVEAYFQTGTISASAAPAAPTLDVSASFVHLEAGYQWGRAWKPRLSAEFDYASGDKPGGDFERFDTLFGMRRAEIAPAGLYNAVGRANLLSPGVRVEVSPGKRAEAFAAWRGLWLAEATDSFSTTGLRDASGAAGRFAGHQIDMRVRYWLVPDRLRLEANGVLVAHGDYLKALRPGERDFTAYASLDLTFSF